MTSLLCLLPLLAEPVTIAKGVFGTTKDGQTVTSFTATKPNGFSVTLISLGATIQALNVPDADGDVADVVLGFDDVAGYESARNPYFGCTVGRFANRIANAEFSIDGKTYRVLANNGPHHLHGGGERNLSHVNWTGRIGKGKNGNGVVVFTYTSPDGEEGYPGNLEVTVRYVIEAKADAVAISYAATTDQATPVNLTNHSYFNLAGHDSGSIVDHRLQINAETYLPSGDDRIPTGEIASVAGTAYDFRKAAAIESQMDEADSGNGRTAYDLNYIVAAEPEGGRELPIAASVRDPKSGRTMLCLTTEPGVQLYTGNGLSDLPGKGGAVYEQYQGLCLETQHYPDSVNQPSFPSTILRPGERFASRTRYVFRTAN